MRKGEYVIAVLDLKSEYGSVPRGRLVDLENQKLEAKIAVVT